MSRRGFSIIVSYQESYRASLVTSKHRFIRRLRESGHNILYIEVPRDLIRWVRLLLQGKILKEESRFTSFTPISLLPTIKGTPFDNRVAAYIESRLVALQLKIMFGDSIYSPDLLLVYIPKAILLVNFLRAKRIAYHAIDDFTALPKSPACLERCHSEAIVRSDIIITPSILLAQELRSRNVRYLPHGYEPYSDDELSHAFPADLVGESYIIYYGQTDKLDSCLVQDVARDFAELRLVVVGNYQRWMDEIDNVEYRGFAGHLETISMAAGAILLWCPFKINRLTSAMAPIKFVEATAIGLPIVTTRLGSYDPDVLSNITLASNPSENLHAIRTIQRHGAVNKREGRRRGLKGREWSELEYEFEFAALHG